MMSLNIIRIEQQPRTNKYHMVISNWANKSLTINIDANDARDVIRNFNLKEIKFTDKIMFKP